jgi:hypothetical protein
MLERIENLVIFLAICYALTIALVGLIRLLDILKSCQ